MATHATAAAGHELKNKYIGVKYFMWDIIMIVSGKYFDKLKYFPLATRGGREFLIRSP